MRPLLIGVAAAMALMAARADAFTFESGGPAKSPEGFQLTDPDSARHFSLDGTQNDGSSMTLFRNGDSSLSFGFSTQQENRPGGFLQPAPFRNMEPRFFRRFPSTPN